jgi:hypothetical protein
MNDASALICRTLGVATERDAHAAVLDRARCQDAALIAGLAAVHCVRRALESTDRSSSLKSRVRRELHTRGYRGPMERSALALADAIECAAAG